MRRTRRIRVVWRLSTALAALLAGRVIAADLPPGYVLRVVPISGGLGLADVALRAPDGEVSRAAVLLKVRAAGRDEPLRVEMRREAVAGSRPAASVFSARVMAGAAAGVGERGTIRFSIALSREGENAAERVLGPFEESAAPGEGKATPDWAKGAVWYQVFPERFRNGNAANDPQGPEFTQKAWTSDWFAFDVDELEAARARVTLEPPHLLRSLPDPRSAAMQARRYGGDLEGVVEKLDELADLGVTAIYLNPVFEARSHHKYDATDFRHIDPAFGGAGDGVNDAALRRETADPATWVWTDADRYVVETLLPEIHQRGMRVVFDGVWNHVGTRFWAFRDVMARGKVSPYAEWFQAEFADESRLADPHVQRLDVRPGSLIAWKSWNGANGTLPTFARNAEGRLNPEVERHIFEVTKRWMSPVVERGAAAVRGIDGWRLDVAPDLPRAFWEAWTAHARETNPDAALLGEFWFDAREYFSVENDAHGKGGRAKVFDGQMNYPVAIPLVRWLADGTYTSTQLAAQLERVLDRPAQHELVQMNLLGSHDTARVATMIEAGLSEYGGQIAQRIQRSRPSAKSYDKVVLGVAFLACWPGSPMVYYGDEYGMHGGNDPACRKPLPWADAGEMENSVDAAEPGLRERFRSWLRLRQDPEIGDVLRYGDVRVIETGNRDVFAFERGLNQRRIIHIANRGDEEFNATNLVSSLLEGQSGLLIRRLRISAGAPEEEATTVAARSEGLFRAGERDKESLPR